MDIFWRFLNHICLSPPPSQTRFTLYRVGEEELRGIYKGFLQITGYYKFCTFFRSEDFVVDCSEAFVHH